MMKSKRIALFGGSFNPIHNDHVKMIRSLASLDLIDEVWVIPCKNHSFDKKMVSVRDRLKMIKIEIRSFSNVKINKTEIKSSNKNYTIDTVNSLTEKYPHSFFWVIGTDILSEIHLWKNYKDLFKKIEFLVFPRRGFVFKKLPGMKISYYFKNLCFKISSTQVRKQAKENKSLKGLVSFGVEQYIKKRKLYQ